MRPSRSIVFMIASTIAKPLIIGDLIPSPESFDSTEQIMSGLDMVQGSVKSLDTSVQKVKPDNLGALGDVANESMKLGNTIKTAQTMIQGTEQVDVSGALRISSSATGLQDSITSLSNNLIAIKPTVDQAGLSSVVADMIKMQQKQSGGLSKLVVSKLPSLAQDMGQEMSQQITDSLNKVIKVYMQPPAKAKSSTRAPAATQASKLSPGTVTGASRTNASAKATSSNLSAKSSSFTADASTSLSDSASSSSLTDPAPSSLSDPTPSTSQNKKPVATVSNKSTEADDRRMLRLLM